MKRLLAMLILSVLLVSCGEYVPEENKVDIKEELKINACVLNRNLEGNGYWEYIDFKDMKKLGEGYWHTDDGKVYETEDVFALEALEVGEVRTLAPLGYNRMHNLNLFVDFEGYIEVETEPIDDERIRLAYSLDYPTEPWRGNKTQENSFRVRAPAAIEAYPIGKFTAAEALIQTFTLTEKEYNITIKAYDDGGDLLVTAKIKLVALDDEHFPSEQFSNWVFAANEEKTRFLTIELVSYEYSDVYKLDESMYEE